MLVVWRTSLAMLGGVVFLGLMHGLGFLFPYSYTYDENLAVVATTTSSQATTTPVRVVTHIKTPQAVKGIYMTNWVGGSPKLRESLVKMIDDTELNTVVLDIKDYTGKIGYSVDDTELKKFGSEEIRIRDIKSFIDDLHSRGIYVIGRISVFQDKYMVTHKPEWAVIRKSDGGIWADRKGVQWIDEGAKPFWDYIVAIGNDAYYNQGFDELNFDYIRFPSDGDMKDIKFRFAATTTKSVVLEHFFEYLREKLGDKGIPISADLFGMTTTNKDDLGIGQILEPALKNFDFVYPMVYPSHYPPGFNGYKNPNANPYEVIHYAMKSAVERAVIASTSPQKLRPWLQDFSLGQPLYSAPHVKAQIKATYDVGLEGWLLWNASNRYTHDALLSERELAELPVAKKVE